MSKQVNAGFGTRERGVVLFVGLIMLLLLSLIGITAMQVTLLQERMSGNFYIQHSAFEASETMLANQRRSLANDMASSGPLSFASYAIVDGSNQPPWTSWVTTEPTVPGTQVFAHTAIGYPPALPNAPSLRYFMISAIDQDYMYDGGGTRIPGVGGDAKAATQAIFIF